MTTPLTSDQKGNVAELAIALAAERLGIRVFRPVGEGGRTDMIFDLPSGRLVRVQCKWGRLVDDVVIAQTKTSRRTAGGHRKRSYDADQIDGVAVYCDALEQCFYVPIERVPQHALHLRVRPAKNNQRAMVMMAEQFALGAVAQLEERRAGSAKVRGSSPLSSM